MSESATQDLRRMLDERGVEYKKRDPMSDLPSADRETRWGRASYREWPSGTTRFGATGTTPEQAIAATLGVTDATEERQRVAGTCKQEERGWSTEGDHARVWLTCGHNCMVETVADLPRFCPNCGRKVVSE